MIGAWNARRVKWATTLASGHSTEIHLDASHLYESEDDQEGLYTELTARRGGGGGGPTEMI